jgi:hypothetical protein
MRRALLLVGTGILIIIISFGSILVRSARVSAETRAAGGAHTSERAASTSLSTVSPSSS